MEMLTKSFFKICLVLIGLSFTLASWSEPASSTSSDKTVTMLDGQIQDLKKEVLDLNRDLFLLEEDLLFPANTQFTVFVSMDIGLFFELDSVQIRLDDKIVGNHLYTEREVAALKRGGVHRFYTGNLTSGEHELVAFFVGKGPKNRDYKRGTTLRVTKGADAQYIELKISDSESKYQPKFMIKVWAAE